MSTDIATEWPLAARASELDRIAAALDTTGGILLIGDPGVGKSCLLRASLARAAGDGAKAVWTTGAERKAVERAERQCGEPGAPQVGSPVVIGVDDAHLVDPHSAARLRALIEDGRASLVASSPSAASAPDGINKLWLDRLIDRMDVEAFDRSGVSEILHTRLGGHVSPATLERFWTFTQGNALFLRELVDVALADGSLRSAGNAWEWSGLPAEPGRRLIDLVHLRLGDLDSDERELVGMLAIAGPLEADLPAVARLAHAAESLNRRGIVIAGRTGRRLRLRLAYPLFGPAVVADLPDLTRRRLCEELADAIEHLGMRREDDVARVVALRVDAGRVPRTTHGIELERAHVLARVGERKGAARKALNAGERAAGSGRRAQALAALHLAARLGAAGEVAEHVTALAHESHSGRAALRAEHVRSLAQRDGAALDTLTRRFGALGLRPLAAETAAQAGEIHRVAGRRADSHAARAACHRWLEDYDGTLPTWANLGAPAAEQHGRLTVREREIAALAAARLTNREIADRLVVSVRTVENHLHRVYGKLGVTARSHLVDHLDS